MCRRRCGGGAGAGDGAAAEAPSQGREAVEERGVQGEGSIARDGREYSWSRQSGK